MSSNKLRILLLGATLVCHGLSLAQSRESSATMGASTVQPLDLRIGAIRSADSRDNITDGGLRTAPTSPATPVQVLTLGKDYRVAPGDLLEVEVYDAPSLKRTVRVNAAGTISLPLIGQLSVAGMTSQEVEELVAARYGEKHLQSPQVSIFLKEYTSERMTIEGAVSRPGIFPLSGKITLLRALAIAGGFGPIANSSQVMIYRVNDQQVREVAVYDVEKIRAGKADDPAIKGDDLIVVQRDSTRALLKDSLFRDVIDSVNPFSVLVPK